MVSFVIKMNYTEVVGRAAEHNGRMKSLPERVRSFMLGIFV